MKLALFSILLVGLTSVAASAEPAKLTKKQMASITAGNPNLSPNGTNVNSNGKSGAPGNSFKAPGQTNNPHPSK